MVVCLETGKKHVFIGDNHAEGVKNLEGQPKNAVIMGSEAASNQNVTVGDTFTADNNEYCGRSNRQGG